MVLYASCLAGQAPTAKVVATCGGLALHPGQLSWVYVDSTGKACVLTAAGANPAGGWLDSLKVLDSLTGIRGTVKVSLSAADSVQIRTGVKHAGRVTVDSLLASMAHVGRVTVDSELDSLKLKTGAAHAGAVNVDSVQASYVHNDSCVTANGGKSVADSVLLPAVTAKRHYLTYLSANLTDTLAVAAAAPRDTLSTTNLPGPLLWRFGNTLALGVTNFLINQAFAVPIRAITAATVTKIRGSAPGTGGYWDITACYILGP